MITEVKATTRIATVVSIALFLGACSANKWRYSAEELGLSNRPVSAEELSGNSVARSPLVPEGFMISESWRGPVKQDTEPFEGDYPHRAALFLGGTFEDNDSGFTIGANYEYRVRQGIGLGGLIEHAGGELDATVVAGVVFLHPYEKWKILVAAGNEHRDGDNDFLVRVGGEYEFPLEDNFSVAPGFYVDFVGGDQKLIFGVDFGIAF